MKKVYIAPTVEIERYELNASIASNCGIVVNNGPAVGNHEQCTVFDDPFVMSEQSAKSTYSAVYNVQFYEDTNCDCYYTAGDYGYWMS